MLLYQDQVVFVPDFLDDLEEKAMADDGNFKDAFNWWYFLGILLALLAFPLMHIIAGLWVFVLRP